MFAQLLEVGRLPARCGRQGAQRCSGAQSRRAPLAAAAEVVMAQQSLRKPAQLMVLTVTINPAKQSTYIRE